MAKKKALPELVGPIAEALAPFRADAVKEAREATINMLARIEKQAEEAGYDLDALAPYPKNGMGRGPYLQALSRRRMFERLFKTQPKPVNIWGKGAPTLLVPGMIPDRVALEIEQAEKDAEFNYDAYVRKMMWKIGDVVSAECVNGGDDVWYSSVLAVVKADGTTERWHTQRIGNVSKLGKYFHQYPSRKVKA